MLVFRVSVRVPEAEMVVDNEENRMRTLLDPGSIPGSSTMQTNHEDGAGSFDPRGAQWGRWETDEDPEDMADDPIDYDLAFGPPNPRRQGS